MSTVSVSPVTAWRSFWSATRAAAIGTHDDNCLSIAKGAAYSGLLAFFPVLTSVAAILVQAKAESVSRTIAEFLYSVVPPGTEDLVTQMFIVRGQRPITLLVVAVILAAWAASGAMMSLMEGFRAIYHLPSGRHFIHERVVAVLLVFISVVPMWGASALVVLGARSENAVVSWLGLIPAGADLEGPIKIVGQILRLAVALGTFVLVTSLIYHIGPNRKQQLRHVLPGASLATILWILATEAFAW